MGVRKPSALKGLRGRLKDLAKEADCYEEVKLNLLLEGWNLDDKPIKMAIRKWLTQSLSYNVNNSYFVRILGLDENISGEQAAARCEVMKGLWEDVVGRKDQEAARIGMMLAANVLDSSWNGLAIADKPDVRALAELVGWFGRLAYSEKKDDGCLESS